MLLRKRLVEFETSGGEGRLVLTTEQIVEMLRLFLAESTNEARVVDQVERRSRRRPSSGSCGRCAASAITGRCAASSRPTSTPQTLSDFAGKLREYAGSGGRR